MRSVFLSVLLAGLAGCALRSTASAPTPPEFDRFWTELSALCGQRFAGTVTEGNASDSAFVRGPLAMHVADCLDTEIRIPFTVGNDASRTWVISRSAGGLRLTHLHLHPDGTEDSVSRYGGVTTGPGSAVRQEFPADSFTAALLPAARGNVWTLEIEPGVRFAYALRRTGTDRRFRADFDLRRPLAAPDTVAVAPCAAARTGRNPLPGELRCRHGVWGPGRFGLLRYVDVPVYQPATPLPGTHVVGVPGLPAPGPGESFEQWEWRVLRTTYAAANLRPYAAAQGLDPFVAARVLRLEARLAREGIPARRRETWRSPERQAFLFQQGRSRAGPFATATLTSWHSVVDDRGHPASRAADYDVAARHLPRFHQIAAEEGLASFGADSNDPGHVFLPLREPVPSEQIVLLRLLPRVAEVTLATGRPADEPRGTTLPSLQRAAAARWGMAPFAPLPELRVARRRPPELRGPATN